MSGPHAEQPVHLTERMRAHYVQQYGAHRSDPETGLCRVCGVARCDAWRNARVMLISAGVEVR